MIKSGYIPEEIVTISSGEQTIQVRDWDDLSVESKITVTPGFIADTEAKDTVATGIRWAESRHRYAKGEKPTIKQEIRKNTPISGIKIVSLETRYGGGRAYKVVTPDHYYFDLREDVLLDVMKHTGVSVGAELNGSFVWGKSGGQTKLVRVGSELHNALNIGGKRREMKKISTKSLEPGKIYSRKNGELGLYIGNVLCYDLNITVKHETTLPQNSRWSSGSWPYNSYDNFNKKPIGWSCSKHPVKEQMLWIEIPQYVKDGKPEERVLEVLKKLKEYTYNIKLKTTQSYVEEIGSIDLPKDAVDFVRDAQIAQIKKSVLNSKTHAIKYNVKNFDEDINFAESVSYSGQIVSMWDVTGTEHISPEIVKVLEGKN